MKIDDVQAENIAKIIIYDISNYILKHQEEYNKFLEAEVKNGKQYKKNQVTYR